MDHTFKYIYKVPRRTNANLLKSVFDQTKFIKIEIQGDSIVKSKMQENNFCFVFKKSMRKHIFKTSNIFF